jgi:hypothetical protein
MKLTYNVMVVIFCALLFSFTFSQSSREIHKSIPLRADGCLVIDTYKGSITITTYEKPQVEVDVKIESDDSESWNDGEDVKDTEIQFEGEGNEITIHTDYENVKNHRHHHSDFWDWITDTFESSSSLPLVHYTIKMPRTAELKIKDYKSRTRIEDLQSDIRLNTYKGEVDIDNLAGGIELETYKGTVRVSFSKIKSDCRFETYKGNVTVVIPKDNGFKLQTDFERRVDFATDFNADKQEHGNKHRRYYDYSGSINGGGPMLEFKSEKGDLRLESK